MIKEIISTNYYSKKSLFGDKLVTVFPFGQVNISLRGKNSI